MALPNVIGGTTVSIAAAAIGGAALPFLLLLIPP
jgi:hypothetical protein